MTSRSHESPNRARIECLLVGEGWSWRLVGGAVWYGVCLGLGCHASHFAAKWNIPTCLLSPPPPRILLVHVRSVRALPA